MVARVIAVMEEVAAVTAAVTKSSSAATGSMFSRARILRFAEIAAPLWATPAEISRWSLIRDPIMSRRYV